ncbi:MAG: DNA adenine methylase [Deltaproteobacteria bacterium]|nr:DNA adenine methylase [Deltaproteobacteria bacterium]
MATSAALLSPIIPQQAPTRAPAPIVKWVGGKGRILRQLEPLLPSGVEMMRHVEPFFGGGALFFRRQPLRALVSDINPELINVYEWVRDAPAALVPHLQALAEGHNQESYYEVRTRYNQPGMKSAERAATFIYLNKTCFNGLHRVNRRGEFNVPAGRYKNPKILDPEGLLAASAALSQAEIRQQGFEGLLESARPGDFVYFDPPYAPVSDTANFTGYAKNGFGTDMQVKLRDVFRVLDRRGCRLMLSNSDVPLIRELYRGFTIDTVAAPRAINCNAKRRGKVSEVVVRNYR